MQTHTEIRDRADGYEAGYREAHDDRWTLATLDAYVRAAPARNAWERGFEEGARHAVTGEPITDRKSVV